MIRHLDARLIAAHQWLVDCTQIAPHKLGGLSAVLSAGILCANSAAPEFPAWVFALALVAHALVFSLTLSPVLFRYLGWLPVRVIQLVALAFDLLMAFLVLVLPQLCSAMDASCYASDRIHLLGALQTAAMLACHYFAACRPPRPRPPRARFALGGAA